MGRLDLKFQTRAPTITLQTKLCHILRKRVGLPFSLSREIQEEFVKRGLEMCARKQTAHLSPVSLDPRPHCWRERVSRMSWS